MHSNTRKDTRVYHLSTNSSSGVIQNQDTNFKSSIFYTIPFLDLQEEGISHVEFSVPYVICPATMHNINYTNNTLDILWGDDVTSNSITAFKFQVQFPAGNYNVNTLIQKFNSLLSGSDATAWKMSFDTFNDTMAIHHTQKPFIVLATSTIKSVLGFKDNIVSTLDSDPTTLAYTAKFPRTVNFLQVPRIHLRCRQFAQSILVGSSPDLTNTDIIVSVPNNAPINGKILYQNTAALTTQIDTPNVTSFLINLTDDAGNLINFNGVPSFFAFQFDIYREIPEEPPPKFRHLLEKMLYHIH